MARVLRHDEMLDAANACIEMHGLAAGIDAWYAAMMRLFAYIKERHYEPKRALKILTDAVYAAHRKAGQHAVSKTPARKAYKAMHDRVRKKALRAMPWADQAAIDAVYAERDAKPDPQNWHVDHQIPIVGKHPITRQHIICGLHVDANLQVVTKAENLKKNCWFDPDTYQTTPEYHD